MYLYILCAFYIYIDIYITIVTTVHINILLIYIYNMAYIFTIWYTYCKYIIRIPTIGHFALNISNAQKYNVSILRCLYCSA